MCASHCQALSSEEISSNSHLFKLELAMVTQLEAPHCQEAKAVESLASQFNTSLYDTGAPILKLRKQDIILIEVLVIPLKHMSSLFLQIKTFLKKVMYK